MTPVPSKLNGRQCNGSLIGWVLGGVLAQIFLSKTSDTHTVTIRNTAICLYKPHTDCVSL